MLRSPYLGVANYIISYCVIVSCSFHHYESRLTFDRENYQDCWHGTIIMIVGYICNYLADK